MTLECRLAKEHQKTAVSVDVPDLRDMFAEISRFRSIAPRPALKDALDFSLDLEDRAAERHVGTALANAEPSLADFIRRLASADRQHSKALRSFRDAQPLGS